MIWAGGLGATGARAAVSHIEVRGVDDKALRREIEAALATAAPPTSRIEARRRSEEAADQAMAVLRSEGYYDAVVEPGIGDGDTPPAFVTITPGPLTHLVQTDIDWSGAPPDAAAQAKVEAVLALKPGDPAKAAPVIAAEGRIVAALLDLGYADAAAQPREVVVDHADHSMHPVFHIAAGGLVHLDGVTLQTKGRTRPRWLRRLAPWRSGQVYKPALLAELERRLRDTGAYDSVDVALSPPSVAVNGLRPVIVSVTDRPKGTLELGASYSTTEGAGVDSRWLLYNRFGRADILTNSIQIAQIDSRIQSQLSLPNWGKPNQTLALTAALYADKTDAYNDVGAGVSADVTHKFGKISFLTYGVSVDETQTTEKEAANYINASRLRDLTTFGLLGAFSADQSNDALNPTKGWRVSGRVEPRYAVGDGSIAYLKTSVEGSTYWPVIGDATVLALRLKLGAIVGGDIPRVPAQDRFYAGGGGSVRGFGYQGVGPRYPDNTPKGGLSLFESAFEVRQHLSGPWGLVAFVDAGSVGTTIVPTFREPEMGAGVGVRYDAGFGPIRVDLATPLTPRRGDAVVQVYLSIGQSF
jgi:translocation and assembly module TamA